jgi:hypothetical protein
MHGRWNPRRGRCITRTIGATCLILALGGGGGLLFAPGSGATGTLSCPNFNDSDVPTPPAGDTGYLFIGTSVSTSTSIITVSYDSTSIMVTGTQEGNGAFHYIVNLPQGSVVTNATVTGATDHTVVTVSGCMNGPAAPTTPTLPGTTPATPGGTQVSPETVVSPESVVRAPTAVSASPIFTG